jgi:PKD repeat protein
MVIDKRAIVTLAIVATAACTVHDQQTPSLTGPSGLALTLRVSASPDTINQDGQAVSIISVTAIGDRGQPKSGVLLRMDIAVGGTPVDFGTLSARTITTDGAGSASVRFTAPPAPVNGIFLDNCVSVVGARVPGSCVSIVATVAGGSAGTDFTTANPESVEVRLVPVGVVFPPSTTPVPCFTQSTSSVAANVAVQFTAGIAVGPGNSAACAPATADIVSFSWDFGDGSAGSGRTVTHTFTTANTFTVTLTETNDRGLSGSKSQPVQVDATAPPTASFEFSPGTPTPGSVVQFTDTSIAATGRAIVRVDWNFGDPTSASNTASSGAGGTATHTYAAVGKYKVVMTATDDLGQRTVTSKDVDVQKPTG